MDQLILRNQDYFVLWPQLAYSFCSGDARCSGTDYYMPHADVTSSTRIACLGHILTQFGPSLSSLQKSHLMTRLIVERSGLGTPYGQLITHIKHAAHFSAS
jgi:hypothetical protein